MTRIRIASLILAGALAADAQAGLLPVSVTVTPEGGNYRWTYAIVLPTDMKLQSGNFFTIYDFDGYLPGGEAAPEGWALSVTNDRGTPDRLNPQDDPTRPNLTFRYAGPTIASGQIGLGNFWAYSMYGEMGEDSFAAETNRTSDGLVDRNLTLTAVPVATNLIPEPATLALAGLGLPLVGLARWVRRRK
jgi:hypothetical protein